MVAVALDLGSTRIKAGLVGPDGRPTGIESAPAPALCGEGPVREGDAEAYAEVAAGVLSTIAARAPERAPLGIATQRSTFVVWERDTGRPVTPLVSWQDTRAAGWVARHSTLEEEIVRRTGLRLSAHYAGPKLAVMQEAHPELQAALRDGRHLFGTLETFVTWKWSRGAAHETDLGVAARTLLVDLDTRDWSDTLLGHFAVPRTVLPAIAPTAGRSVPLDNGLRLAATVSDQASGALALLEHDARVALINVGTGAFVLRRIAGEERRHGYLTAPLGGGTQDVAFALEGTINGAGPALDRFGEGPTELPPLDPSPAAFAIPDVAGLGSPYWYPEIGLTLSPAAMDLDDRGRRRAVLEGLLFRIAGILADLFEEGPPERVLLAGGASRDPALAAGLATLVDRPVEVLLEPEIGLAGAGRLAANFGDCAPAATRVVEPGLAPWLPGKYVLWRAWLLRAVSGTG